jgi:hypothetical protein
MALGITGAAVGCVSETDALDPEAQADDELNTRKSLFANDVSVLFTLPKGRDIEQLLGAASAGAKGELLPKTTFDKIPRLLPDAGAPGAREEMRVLSLRIDPCFPGLGVEDPGGCKNQIRLVFQPVQAPFPDEAIDAKDAAVHAFYTMSRDEFSEMAKEILAAKHGARGSVRTALGPHPLIEEQGLGGVFATELKAVVLKHAGKANLTRVTFMTREPPRQPQWKFGGFDIEGARHTKMKIASLGETTEQTFTTLARNGNANPAVRSEDNISILFRTFEAQGATLEAKAKAYTSALRIQNPTMHSPDTVDCVSCHTATSARIWAEKNMNQSATNNPARFKARFSTALTKSPASERPDNLHSFGYLGTEASVSQRTANESAAVAEYINTKILTSR